MTHGNGKMAQLYTVLYSTYCSYARTLRQSENLDEDEKSTEQENLSLFYVGTV